VNLFRDQKVKDQDHQAISKSGSGNKACGLILLYRTSTCAINKWWGAQCNIRPRKPKIGTKEAHHITSQRSKVKVARLISAVRDNAAYGIGRNFP